MDASQHLQGNIHVLGLEQQINVSRILGTYDDLFSFFCTVKNDIYTDI